MFLITTSEYFICLNWLSGALVGVGGSDFIDQVSRGRGGEEGAGVGGTVHAVMSLVAIVTVQGLSLPLYEYLLLSLLAPVLFHRIFDEDVGEALGLCP